MPIVSRIIATRLSPRIVAPAYQPQSARCAETGFTTILVVVQLVDHQPEGGGPLRSTITARARSARGRGDVQALREPHQR
jgi:hypothetical protein